MPPLTPNPSPPRGEGNKDMLHAECKTPGGKLVAVDLDVADGRLANVRVRGDFFLDPEADAERTLAAIAAGLAGAPADADAAALAARVRAAIPYGVEVLGTSPDAVALAVRRAVTGDADLGDAPPLPRIGAFTEAEIDERTTAWKSIPWRVVAERPAAPALNVALDEVLTDRVGAGRCPPTLRFWRWSAPA